MKTKSIVLAIIFIIALSATSYAQFFDINRAALMKSTNTTIGLLYGESTTKCVVRLTTGHFLQMKYPAASFA